MLLRQSVYNVLLKQAFVIWAKLVVPWREVVHLRFFFKILYCKFNLCILQISVEKQPLGRIENEKIYI